MNNTDVPIWERYTLTIEEASKYFRIGEKKLRKLAEENINSENEPEIWYTIGSRIKALSTLKGA